MSTSNIIISNQVPELAAIGQVSDRLYEGVVEIIDKARTVVVAYVNAQASLTFWNVGNYIINDMEYQAYSAYGQKILATVAKINGSLWERLHIFRPYQNDECGAHLQR